MAEQNPKPTPKPKRKTRKTAKTKTPRGFTFLRFSQTKLCGPSRNIKYDP